MRLGRVTRNFLCLVFVIASICFAFFEELYIFCVFSSDIYDLLSRHGLFISRSSLCDFFFVYIMQIKQSFILLAQRLNAKRIKRRRSTETVSDRLRRPIFFFLF